MAPARATATVAPKRVRCTQLRVILVTGNSSLWKRFDSRRTDLYCFCMANESFNLIWRHTGIAVHINPAECTSLYCNHLKRTIQIPYERSRATQHPPLLMVKLLRSNSIMRTGACQSPLV